MTIIRIIANNNDIDFNSEISLYAKDICAIEKIKSAKTFSIYLYTMSFNVEICYQKSDLNKFDVDYSRIVNFKEISKDVFILSQYYVHNGSSRY